MSLESKKQWQLYVLQTFAKYDAKQVKELCDSEGELGVSLATYLAFAMDE